MTKLWISFLLLFSTAISAQDLLQEKDVNKIMEQILDMHLDGNKITPQILQTSIDRYIEQFDPNHIYLLESEVAPFVNLSPSDLKRIQDEYKDNKYNEFEALSKLFQKAILRSREIRKELEANKSQIFQDKTPLVPFSTETWATTLNELKTRQQTVLKLFIASQLKHYGESKINQNRSAIIHDYENYLRSFENQYLFVDDKGQPLAKGEQENLLSIHMLKALAGSLDSHTSFYQSNEAYDLRVRLKKEIEGIGIAMQEKPEGVVVTRLIPDSPAEKSGKIKEGDIIQKINGESVEKYSVEKISDILHGSNDTEVKIEFKRKSNNGTPDSTYEAVLKREIIALNTDRVDVRYEKFGNGIIGKITLHAFYENEKGVTSENDIRAAIKKLQEIGPLRGLILDLRDNSGGFLSQAVKVAGLFITNGVIVVSKYSDGKEKFYRDVDGTTAFDGPLVVLVSKVTASAAEIVAQALQDYGVAVIVGDEHTYGKGTIQMQTVTDNRSTSYFKVTVGTYYTVSGKTPQKNGVKSDIVVPGHWNEMRVGEEFLNSVAPDNISPSFTDNLQDVSSDVKPWYLKYYVNSLQRRSDRWRALLPALRKNSEHRIAHNKNYQFYLKGPSQSLDDNEDETDYVSNSGKKKNYGEDDLQLQEAVNIVKDMIVLHADAPRN